jgi:methionyl-tRNA formyltransferase
LRHPLTLITQLGPEDGRPEKELVALLQACGIVGRVVRTESEVRELAGETVLVMNWLKRIRPEVIQRNRILLNLHNSLLPRYRGRHAFAWALIHGEREVGYTLHAIDEGFDTGPIYAQRSFPVGADDDINDVFASGHRVLKTWLPDVLQRFDAGLLTPAPQDERLASYYHPRTPEDGRIAWTQPGHAIRNLVRALRSPYTPGAFFQAAGCTYHVDRCSIDPNGSRYPPGLVLDCDVASNTVQVACGDGILRLVLVSRPGAPTAQDLRPVTLLPP